jgi:fatty acid CoA ligase FadD9
LPTDNVVGSGNSFNQEVPMSTDTRADAQQRRIQNLYESDPQFAAARPDEAVSAAIERPGLRLPQLVHTVMDGYANRPALGQRAVQLVKDPDTGRTTAEVLPRFETITYREMWQRRRDRQRVDE